MVQIDSFVDVISLDYVFTAWVIALLIACLVQVAHILRGFLWPVSYQGKHVFITGGSQGLGLHLACEFAKRGASVSITARGAEALAEARLAVDDAAAHARKRRPSALAQDEERASLRSGLGEGESAEGRLSGGGTATAASLGACFAVCGDVTDEKSLENAVKLAVNAHGPVDVLVTCAGKAYTGLFDDVSAASFRLGMDLNYMGTVHAIKAVLPQMKVRRKGQIVLVSSALALTAYAGYSAYAPSKFALKGLALSLRNELQGHGIAVNIAYPPNMDTPGFKVEQATKPPATLEIEEGESLYQAADCARHVMGSLERNEFQISCGDFGVNVLSRAAAGLSPRTNSWADALLLPLLVVVGKVYLWNWDRITRKHAKQK